MCCQLECTQYLHLVHVPVYRRGKITFYDAIESKKFVEICAVAFRISQTGRENDTNNIK